MTVIRYQIQPNHLFWTQSCNYWYLMTTAPRYTSSIFLYATALRWPITTTYETNEPHTTQTLLLRYFWSILDVYCWSRTSSHNPDCHCWPQLTYSDDRDKNMNLTHWPAKRSKYNLTICLGISVFIILPYYIFWPFTAD